ncbi:hypothetical protein K456DRAFT_395699 [Colletotrichum gloeosporioides 23]|nr:hypothetical protein K456DRAFT_395699 [Colletotrichum gloeosporioides 23]
MDYKTRLRSLNRSIRAAAAAAPAPPTFPRFQDFPCEIRLMIWREFFLEPRFFQSFCQMLQAQTKGDSYSLRWTLVHHGSSRTYYTSIDTQINKESTDVARKIRPKSCLPIFSPQIAGWGLERRWDSNPVYFHVNWDVDFINLDDADPRLQMTSDECLSWYSKVRNLSLGPPRQGYITGPFDYLSQENEWLWERRSLFPNLKSIIHCQDPFWAPWHNSAFYFQTRYLLRYSQKIPPQWKDVAYKVCFLSPWTVPDSTQPRWTDFLEQLRTEGWQLDMDYLKDEAEGAKHLFEWLLEP